MARRTPRPFRPGRASIKASTIRKAERDNVELRQNEHAATGDAFANYALNIGYGTNNALSQSSYNFAPITLIRPLLDWIHRGSWLGGIAIDLLADDMTRGGIELTSTNTPEDSQKLHQAMVRKRVWKGINDNTKWAKLYGGSLAIILLEGQNPETPLRIDTVMKDQFKGLMVADRWMVEPDLQHLVREFGPHMGEPEWYRVISDAPAMRNQRVHYSRCLRQEGIRLPYWQRVMNNLWGLSVFERLYDRMIAFDSATMGAAQLVYKSYLRTYAIDGLREAASAGGNSLQGIVQLVEMMRKWQGIEGITLIDKEDKFEAHAHANFSGIADALLQFAQQLSGALQIPLVRLMGQSPAGLNSTGESDLRTYYDGILTAQEDELREGMNTILRVTAKSEQIEVPDDFNFNFTPLWQLNEGEKSEISDRDTKSVIETEAAGLISQRTALKELQQHSKVTGRWTNITDQQIEEADDTITPPEMEMAEAQGMMGGEGEGGEGEGGEEGPPDNGGGGGKEKGNGKEKPGAGGVNLGGLQNWKKIKKAVGAPSGDARDAWHQGAFEEGKAAGLLRGETAPKPNNPYAGQRESQYEEMASSWESGYLQGTRMRVKDSLPFSEIGGLQVVIEQPRGSIRSGEWGSVIMPADYGYIRRVPSAEGDEEWLDCFIGPYHSSREVWVIDSVNPETGKFDEHKVMLGFRTSKDALACFRKAYHDSAVHRIGGVTHCSMNEGRFKDWLASGDMKRPLAPPSEKAA